MQKQTKRGLRILNANFTLLFKQKIEILENFVGGADKITFVTLKCLCLILKANSTAGKHLILHF